jgi:hypothetical protein
VIASLNHTQPDRQVRDWQNRFLLLVPSLRRAANFRVRNLSHDRRQEVVDDIIGVCFAFYARLVARGQEERAYCTALVRFAAARLRQGRQIGCPVSIRDISNRYCREKRGLQLERLDLFDGAEGTWQEVLITDRRATPADLAASRIDFGAWLATMSPLRRQLAQFLSIGESTRAAARRFAVSPARVSQLRREFQKSWNAFHGELIAAVAAA